MKSDEITVLAEFTSLDGSAEEVKSLLAGLSTQVRSEPGNVTFIAYSKAALPNEFVVYERYMSEDAFHQHLQYQHGIDFNRLLKPLIVDGHVTVSILEEIEN